MHIERFVVNSRPILCLGSDDCDIAIYYLDEPADGRKAFLGFDGKVKQKQVYHFPFSKGAK